MKSHRSSADWRERAECAQADIYDPDVWFDDVSFAKEVCTRRCPVVEECLSWALTTRDVHGVMGGLSEGERRRVRRKMRKERAA